MNGACGAVGDPADAETDAHGKSSQDDAKATLAVTVGEDGQATFQVPPRSAVAIHAGMTPGAEP